MYAYDCNAILLHPLKIKQGHEIKAVCATLHNCLVMKGLAPSTYIMDNEASGALKNAITKNKSTFQLTPPHIPFDFTRTPMTPLGNKIVIHYKATKRASCAYHGQLGFYIGLAIDHYRCLKCFVPQTRQE